MARWRYIMLVVLLVLGFFLKMSLREQQAQERHESELQSGLLR
jgi:hypothetical protein